MGRERSKKRRVAKEGLEHENIQLRISAEDLDSTIQALVTDIADALRSLGEYEVDNNGLPQPVADAYLTLEKAIFPLREKYLAPYKDGQATGF